MNATDDISERVASMLFEFLISTGKTVIGAAPPVISAVNEASNNFTKKILDRFDIQKYMKMDGKIDPATLKNVVDRLKVQARTISYGDTDAKDFEAMLNAEKILYAKLDSKVDNYVMFMYMNKDAHKVENIRNAMNVKRGTVTEISPSLFVQSLKPEHAVTISGLDDEELELFRHYARETEVLFTTVSRPEGNMLILPAEDEEKARQALLYTSWALTGRHGYRVRQQVQYRLRGRTSITISAEDAARELFVVSRINPSNYVQITAEDYRVYKDNKIIATVSRNADNFYTRYVAACEALAEPVVVEPEQMGLLSPERLRTKPTIDLFPEDYNDHAEMQIQNRLRSLIQQKMSIDDEGDTPLDISDPSISYSTFASYEYIFDEEERASREMEFEHYKKAYSALNKRFDFNLIERNNKNLDYIISQAESKKHSAIDADIQKHRDSWSSRQDKGSTPGL